jgi:hypothetical protein
MIVEFQGDLFVVAPLALFNDIFIYKKKIIVSVEGCLENSYIIFRVHL